MIEWQAYGWISVMMLLSAPEAKRFACQIWQMQLLIDLLFPLLCPSIPGFQGTGWGLSQWEDALGKVILEVKLEIRSIKTFMADHKQWVTTRTGKVFIYSTFSFYYCDPLELARAFQLELISKRKKKNEHLLGTLSVYLILSMVRQFWLWPISSVVWYCAVMNAITGRFESSEKTMQTSILTYIAWVHTPTTPALTLGASLDLAVWI